MMKLINRVSPYVIALSVSGSFYRVMYMSTAQGTVDMWSLFVPPVVLSFIIVLITFFVVRGHVSLYHRIRMAVTPVVLMLSAYGYLMLAETAFARHAITILTTLALFVYFEWLRRLSSLQKSEGGEFAHFSFALHVVSSFFLFSFAYGLLHLMHPPVSLIAPMVGIVLISISFETMRRAGIKASRSVPIAAALALLATELFVAISFLPTSYIVDSLVLTILFSLALKVTRGIMKSEGDAQMIRRQVFASFILVILVLSTARWV